MVHLAEFARQLAQPPRWPAPPLTRPAGLFTRSWNFPEPGIAIHLGHDLEKGNTMRSKQESSEREGLASLDSSDVEVLSPGDERSLLKELAACKTKLARALASIEESKFPPGPMIRRPWHTTSRLPTPATVPRRRGWVRSIASTRNFAASWPWPT